LSSHKLIDETFKENSKNYSISISLYKIRPFYLLIKTKTT